MTAFWQSMTWLRSFVVTMPSNSLRWSDPDLHRTAYATMMIPDAMVPNGCQVISSQHGDAAMTKMSHEPYYAISCNNHQTNYVHEKSEGRQPVGFFAIVGVVLLWR